MDTFDPYLVTGHLHPGDYDDPDFQEPLRPRDYDAMINTGVPGARTLASIEQRLILSGRTWVRSQTQRDWRMWCDMCVQDF